MSSEALRAAWGESAAALEIDCVDETGSTNADLLERCRNSLERRARLLVAERQTAGRGRRGRPWQSTPGASLTFSLAWPLAAGDLSGLSLALGVAVAEAIDPDASAHARVALKWPNDLWLVDAVGEGRKLGGILIETTPIGERRVAVVGIGLNVLEQRVADAASGVAWLREIDPVATPESTLLRLVPNLMRALATFDAEGFAAFAARFAARDLLRGRAVCCAGSGPARIDGVAEGVSRSGELLVRTARGVQAVGSGEVSARLAEDPSPAMGRSAGAPC
ncbi:MAG: biotin--[acetyl-CoA-carboxylase] ligase [Caldimonas sp.]